VELYASYLGNSGCKLLQQNLSTTRLPHPAFYSGGDNLAVAANLLTESEWRVLGLIWKLYPSPVGKLVKYNADGSETIIRELKD
jgi:hypothetical protein